MAMTQKREGADEMLQPAGTHPMNSSDDIKREKYWRELTIEEKFERMRTFLKSFVSENSNLRSRNQELEDFIWHHKHEANGEVTYPVKENNKYKLSRYGSNFDLKTPATDQDSEDFYI